MKKSDEYVSLRRESNQERQSRADFIELFKQTPIPDREILQNLGLYTNRKSLSRLLYIHDLYRQILDVSGVIVEFGVRWGQNLAFFESFRGMYEPYNYTRKIIGFDTFDGYSSIDAKKDGLLSAEAKAGDYKLGKNYEEYLAAILKYHESESPVSHLQKFELIKGDAAKTAPRYFREHPETMVALAYIDIGLYKPTKACLEAVLPHLTRGSIIAFDEFGHPEYPGETLAAKEVLDLTNYRLRRSTSNSYPSYFVVD